MQIQTYTFGPFATNTYIVTDEQGHVLLIDPACSNEYERQQLLNHITRQSSNRSLTILATHGHLDHLWGAKWATEQWNVPVLMHPDDIPMAQAMQQQYDLFGIRRQAESFPIADLKSEILNHKFEILNHKFEILNTPGHTPGSICLYWPEEKVLFSGDTLFCMGYGRTDLPGGNMGQLISSLERLFDLPGDVKVYPGHGESTTIGAERR